MEQSTCIYGAKNLMCKGNESKIANCPKSWADDCNTCQILLVECIRNTSLENNITNPHNNTTNVTKPHDNTTNPHNNRTNANDDKTGNSTISVGPSVLAGILVAVFTCIVSVALLLLVLTVLKRKATRSKSSTEETSSVSEGEGKNQKPPLVVNNPTYDALTVQPILEDTVERTLINPLYNVSKHSSSDEPVYSLLKQRNEYAVLEEKNHEYAVLEAPPNAHDYHYAETPSVQPSQANQLNQNQLIE